MNYYMEYKQKLRKPEEAVKVVKSGDWVDYGFALGQPVELDKALAQRKVELKDIKVRGGLFFKPLEIIKADPKREVFTYSSWHFSGYERKLHDQGLCSYIPMIYRNKPFHYQKNLEVNVAFMSVTPMDKHGYFNFSLTNSATKAILEKAEIVILEINEKLPRALGGKDECIHISDVNYIVESNATDVFELPSAPLTDIDIKVANYIIDEIEDGCTIQLGIGGMPNAVGKLIAESDLQDLGMHTEMLVDAYYEIYEAGKLTNKFKNIDNGKGAWSFCVGSKKLYEWVDNNPGLAAYPINYTNSPYIMAQNDKLRTINNCVEIDLFGQTSSESAGTRQISGTGGQLDFVTGGYISKVGKSFVCFSSTYTDRKTGEIKSRIVPTLPSGEIVTDPRTQANFFVTEWGKVNLAGRSTWERAEMIISIAHPNFREELIKAAKEMNIWRRSNKIT